MTAMPPTTGHFQLVQFASRLAENGVVVVLCTQPHEPFSNERAMALRQAIKDHGLKRVTVRHYAKTLPQDPKTPGFWGLWRTLLVRFGIEKGDYIVASEPYGKKVAEVTGTQFFPYDIARTLNSVKATPVREAPLSHFADILPEFRPNIRTRVTIFGAESTGKTTLSRQLAMALGGQWLFEYARSYLEQTVNEITIQSMTAIWKGQRALQEQADDLTDSPYVIQDTDLFSTIGYWQFPHWESRIGSCPSRLIDDAKRLQSDLYIVTKSNIPFEIDPLRYGGDKREGSDEYWINVCRQYALPFIILSGQHREDRLQAAKDAVLQRALAKTGALAYDRHGL
jgi:HTH-type transcriptional repressor of NAD biosynthesis genes